MRSDPPFPRGSTHARARAGLALPLLAAFAFGPSAVADDPPAPAPEPAPTEQPAPPPAEVPEASRTEPAVPLVAEHPAPPPPGFRPAGPPLTVPGRSAPPPRRVVRGGDHPAPPPPRGVVPQGRAKPRSGEGSPSAEIGTASPTPPSATEAVPTGVAPEAVREGAAGKEPPSAMPPLPPGDPWDLGPIPSGDAEAPEAPASPEAPLEPRTDRPERVIERPPVVDAPNVPIEALDVPPTLDVPPPSGIVRIHDPVATPHAGPTPSDPTPGSGPGPTVEPAPPLPPGPTAEPLPRREPEPESSLPFEDVGLELPPESDYPFLPGERASFAEADVPSDDPWGPPAPPAEGTHAPVAPPTAGEDPWGFTTHGGLPPTGAERAGGGPAPSASPPGETDPVTPPASTRPPVAEEPFDPWGAPAAPMQPRASGPSPATPTDVAAPTEGRSTVERARAHALRLRDRPGDPAIPGYPPDLLLRADPRAALRPGSRPAVVAFADDASRESDLAAAALLPTLAADAGRYDFVVIEAEPRATDDAAHDTLRRTYLRDVPTIVVLPPDRRAPRLFTGRIDAAEFGIALAEALRMPAATPADDGLGTAPASEPRLPGGGVDPFDPTSTASRPPLDDVVALTLDAHVQRLRQSPGDPRVAGYPSSIVPTADARTVLERGTKPVVIVFFDDSSKASDLQAADFLPVLVRRARDIDVVAIDIGVRAQWNTYQKQIVHAYYMGFVPTTTVLTARREPVKSWYQRVSGEQLDRAIEESLAARRR